MILLTLRKFWWIPLLVIAGGLFLLPSGEKKSATSEYSSKARLRTRSAFAAELRAAADHFKDSSECLKELPNIETEVISTREDEYIFIDLRFSANDSSQLASALTRLDKCIRSDSSINALVFERVNEIKRLHKEVRQLLDQIPAIDSVHRVLLKKDEFDLRMRENDIQDHYRYQAATTISLQKTVSGGSNIKRILILSLVGVFLMVLVAEVSRRRNSKE